MLTTSQRSLSLKHTSTHPHTCASVYMCTGVWYNNECVYVCVLKYRTPPSLSLYVQSVSERDARWSSWEGRGIFFIYKEPTKTNTDIKPLARTALPILSIMCVLFCCFCSLLATTVSVFFVLHYNITFILCTTRSTRRGCVCVAVCMCVCVCAGWAVPNITTRVERFNNTKNWLVYKNPPTHAHTYAC